MSNKQTLFRVLSWGCGLQSTVLGEMSARGDLERLDLIITADTQWERQATYDVRDWYIERWRNMGMNVEIVTVGNVKKLGAKKHIHIPFWTSDGGPLHRQCTRHFKIRPIRRRIRQLLGYDASKPPHPRPGSVELWMGVTVDEYTRAKRSKVQYIYHRWPLLELRMVREQCTEWLQSHDLPIPPKSACIGCPYRRASEWIEIRNTAPDEWKEAILFDNANRDNPLASSGASSADHLYIWRGHEPLADADLEFEATKERRIYATQLPMFACESGYCGI